VNNQRERGSVLVEFALVSLVLWLLFAISIDFGRLMFSAQALQDAARIAARELAITPLPANISFEGALNYMDPGTGMFLVRDRIFNPACLVINLENFMSDDDVDAFVATMPVVNRALRPLMFVDLSGGRRLLRYPGALLSDTSGSPLSCGTQPPTTFVVGIPQVVSRAPETIEWIPVVQEIRSDPSDPATGPFSVVSTATPAGLVAIRLNYPYEAAAITSFQANPPGPLEFEPNIDNPTAADEGAVVELDPTKRPGDTLPDDSADPNGFGPYKGPYGLGRQLAFASTVRPYSRVLSGQAISRREVFLP
jgi:TadE-like protein